MEKKKTEKIKREKKKEKERKKQTGRPNWTSLPLIHIRLFFLLSAAQIPQRAGKYDQITLKNRFPFVSIVVLIAPIRQLDARRLRARGSRTRIRSGMIFFAPSSVFLPLLLPLFDT